MKREIIKYICDDCHKTSYDPKYLHKYVWKNEVIELCEVCASFRVHHSKNMLKDVMCINCNGTGQVKEPYYHNEFSWIPCPVCLGSSVIKERRR